MSPRVARSFLDDYRDRERSRGEAIANRLLGRDHTILDPQAIYPEYELDHPVGIHRPGVNLALLLFLHRQVVAYVPPITRDQFAHRFGIDYETFLRLAYPEDHTTRFIFPLLNHPRRYSSPDVRHELREILLRMPPTWERWHQALTATGADCWFQRSDEAFNYQAIWSIPEMRRHWRHRLSTHSESFVSKEIKQQIRNNYADLCLVGLEQEANSIGAASHTDPELAVNDLFYSSDVYAYPAVMGAGGIASIRATRSPLTIRHRSLDRAKEMLPSAEYFDSDVFRALLEGLRFDGIPSDFHVDFLLAWHESDNADRARSAFKVLLAEAKRRSPSPDRLHATMTAVVSELREFCRTAEPSTAAAQGMAQARQNVVSVVSILGGIGCTITGFFVHDMLSQVSLALIGSGISLIELGTGQWQSRDHVLRGLLRKHAPYVPPDLYKYYRGFREFSEEFFRRAPTSPTRVTGEPHPGATSAPVRTIWWSDT